MTWHTDDRRLYWEQRRLDAMQAEALAKMTPEQRALTGSPLPAPPKDTDDAE